MMNRIMGVLVIITLLFAWIFGKEGFSFNCIVTLLLSLLLWLMVKASKPK